MCLSHRSNKWVNEWYCIEAAWVCLLVPIAGLVYLMDGFLFSSDLPLVAKLMVWNLLVTYSLFGIIPSIIYFLGMGLHQLDWVLDDHQFHLLNHDTVLLCVSRCELHTSSSLELMNFLL